MTELLRSWGSKNVIFSYLKQTLLRKLTTILQEHTALKTYIFTYSKVVEHQIKFFKYISTYTFIIYVRE